MADGLSFLPTQQPGPGPTDAPLPTFQSYSAFTTSIYDYTTTITRIAYDPQGIAAPTQIIQIQPIATTSIGYNVVYRPLLYTGPIPAPPLGTLYTTAGEILITASSGVAAPTPTPTVTGSDTSPVNTAISNTSQGNSGINNGIGQSISSNQGLQNGNGDQAASATSPSISTSATLPTPTPAPTPTSSSTLDIASNASLQSSLASEASVSASNAAASASLASISATNAAQSSLASAASASASSALSSASDQSASASRVSTSIASPTASIGGTPTTRPNSTSSDLSAGQIAGIVIGSLLALLLLLLLCLLCFRRRRRNHDGGEGGFGTFSNRKISEKWSTGFSRGEKGGQYAAIGAGAGLAAAGFGRNRSDELEEDHLSGGDGSGFLVVGGRRLEGASRTSLPRTDPNTQSSVLKGGLAGLGAGIAAKFASRKPVSKDRRDDVVRDWDHEDGEMDRMIGSDDDADGDLTNGGGRGLMSFDIGQDTSDVLQSGPSGWTTPPSLVPGHQEYAAANTTSPESEGAWLAGLGATNRPPPPSYTEQSSSTQSDEQVIQSTRNRTDRIPSSTDSIGEGDLGLAQNRVARPGPYRNVDIADGPFGSLDALAAGHRGSSMMDNEGSDNGGHSVFISKNSNLLGPDASQSRLGGSRRPMATLSTSSQTDSSNSSNARCRQGRYQESSGSTGAASYSPSYLARQTTASTRGGSGTTSMSSRDVARGGSNSSSSRSRRQRYPDGGSSHYPESDAQSSRATAGGAQDDQRWDMGPGLPLDSVQESQEDQGNVTGHYYPSDSLGTAMQRRAAQELGEGQRQSSWRPSPRVESLSQRAAANMENAHLPVDDDAPLLESNSNRVEGRSRDRGLLDRFLRPT